MSASFLVAAVLLGACRGNGGESAVEPVVTPATAADSRPTSTPLPTPDPNDPRQGLRVDARAVTSAWGTDWSKATVPLSEFAAGVWGDDPRDRIRPIDEPVFESLAEAAEWLTPDAAGVMVRVGDEVRFYPLAMLIRHEIVNDVFGDVPVAVTYCPLCNSALAFERVVDGRTLRLGVSGLLRNSDLVMWDDATESLWQQLTGEAIVGELAGERLALLSTAIVSFEQFAAEYPEASSLSRRTLFRAEYGGNPYPGYSSQSGPAIQFYADEVDGRLAPMDRVVGVSLGGEHAAYAFPDVAAAGAVNDIVGERPIAILWGGETLDALDHYRMADSQPVGTAVAYSSEVDGRVLTFEPVGEAAFVDVETGSTWNVLGRAVAGELTGTRLTIVPHRNEFWFVFDAFFPDGRLYSSSADEG